MLFDLEPGRNHDGTIDYAFYKARAERLRQEAIRALSRRVVDWISRGWPRRVRRPAGIPFDGEAAQESRRGTADAKA